MRTKYNPPSGFSLLEHAVFTGFCPQSKKKGNQTVVNFAGVDKCAEKGGANDKGFREL